MSLQIPPTSKLSIMSDHFEKLQQELHTKITLLPEKLHHSSLISDNPVTIEIVGNPTQVEHCRVRVLVLLDEMVSQKKKIRREKTTHNLVDIWAPDDILKKKSP